MEAATSSDAVSSKMAFQFRLVTKKWVKCTQLFSNIAIDNSYDFERSSLRTCERSSLCKRQIWLYSKSQGFRYKFPIKERSKTSYLVQYSWCFYCSWKLNYYPPERIQFPRRRRPYLSIPWDESSWRFQKLLVSPFRVHLDWRRVHVVQWFRPPEFISRAMEWLISRHILR